MQRITSKIASDKINLTKSKIILRFCGFYITNPPIGAESNRRVYEVLRRLFYRTLADLQSAAESAFLTARAEDGGALDALLSRDVSR